MSSRGRDYGDGNFDVNKINGGTGGLHMHIILFPREMRLSV